MLYPLSYGGVLERWLCYQVHGNGANAVGFRCLIPQ
jgi:hypothetical protein